MSQMHTCCSRNGLSVDRIGQQLVITYKTVINITQIGGRSDKLHF